ncbi:MAG: hypothetical protein FIA99_07780, partial [Ruminiclostridium sp.]|nr:hypothetical protein [Ruminiclostridium sp.]
MNNIMTGTAETEIKLVKGMDLTGYVARTSASIGMHDKLKIKCIVFYDGSVKYAFVECDLLGLSGSFSGET